MLPLSDTIEKYDQKKLEYLRKKTEQKNLERERVELREKLRQLQEQKNTLKDSDPQEKERIDEQIEQTQQQFDTSELNLNTVDTEVTGFETELKEIIDITKTDSYLSTYDKTQKKDTDIFGLSIPDNIDDTVKAHFKQPHNMSDFDIVENFKKLKENALDWISACPKWEHIRLMDLYDHYLSNPDENEYSKETNVPRAIISKSDAGLYEFNFTKNSFKKISTIPKDTTVTVSDSALQVKTYKKETYVQIKYVAGQDFRNKTTTEKTAYVKTKNLTFKGYTMNLLSTIDSSEEFTENLASTTNELLRSVRYGLFTKKRESVAAEQSANDSFKLNDTVTNLPNPALLSDKEIYDIFVNLSQTVANYWTECEKWIDAYYIHQKRLSEIYNKFKKQNLKKTVKKSDNSPAQLPDSDLELSTEKPQTLLAKITKKNVNVYIKDGTTLTRVADLHENDFVKVKIKALSGNTNELKFDFLKYENKKYLPIFCLSGSKILHGYVNSDFVSFVTTNEESVLEEANHTQAIKNASNDDTKSIETLEKTVRSRSDIKSTDTKYSNLYKNPAFMSEQEIADNIKDLDDFDSIYKWVEAFPLERKRIKNIYDRLYEQPKISNVDGVELSTTNTFSTEKPKTMMATVIRDKANVYPADGNSIKFISAGSQKSKGAGVLKKGAKIRLVLNESLNNTPSASTTGTNTEPVFTYHKDSKGKNTHYLKIEYVGQDLRYTEGFISANAVSIYTTEQEADDILSTILSDDLGDNLDLSLEDSKSGWDYIEESNGIVDSVGNSELKVSKELSFNKDAYDLTISSFGSAASLINLAISIKEYYNSDIHNFADVINSEFLGVLSSLSSSASSVISLSQIIGENANKQKYGDDSKVGQGLKDSGAIFSMISSSFDFAKALREQIPEYWNHIKKREGMNVGDIIGKLLDLLDAGNGIFKSLSEIFEKAPIPIISSAISVFSTSIKLLMDIIKFAKYEIQVFKMFNMKKHLKTTYTVNKNKKDRAADLDALNKKINNLQFKGIRRTENENTLLKQYLEQRSQYMDIFITDELEQINKKRRNRTELKITQDILNLCGDITGLLATTIPEPHAIMALTMTKMGAKAASAGIGIGAAAARNIKQWYRDKQPDNPNNTRNKQIRYAKISAGILNNLATLPLVPKLSPTATAQEKKKHKDDTNKLKERYTLLESHIIASGTSVKELIKCNGDVGTMFRLLFTSLQKRE